MRALERNNLEKDNSEKETWNNYSSGKVNLTNHNFDKENSEKGQF